MAGEHLWVRVGGFGRAVLPRRAPFDLSIDPANSHRLIVRVGDSEEVVDPNSWSSMTSVDIVEDGPAGPWRLQTSAFELRFPPSLRLVSSADPSTPPGFDLLGANGECFYFIGPTRSPRWQTPASLVAEGESLEHHQLEPLGVTVAYRVDGEPWWQVRRVAEVSPTSQLLAVLQVPFSPTREYLSLLDELRSNVQQPSPSPNPSLQRTNPG